MLALAGSADYVVQESVMLLGPGVVSPPTYYYQNDAYFYTSQGWIILASHRNISKAGVYNVNKETLGFEPLRFKITVHAETYTGSSEDYVSCYFHTKDGQYWGGSCFSGLSREDVTFEYTLPADKQANSIHLENGSSYWGNKVRMRIKSIEVFSYIE